MFVAYAWWWCQDKPQTNYGIWILIRSLCNKSNSCPIAFNGDVLFELPLRLLTIHNLSQMQGMDRKYDGHAWCKLVTTNKKNLFRFSFMKACCLWRAPKSLVEPTWGFNYVELRKVGTWGPLPTSSTKRGRGAC